MIIAIKIIIAIITIVLLYFASTFEVQKIKWKTALLFVIGLVPYFIIVSLLSRLTFKLLFTNKNMADHVSETYTMFFIMPCIIIILRFFFNTIFSSMANYALSKGGMTQKNINEKTKGLYLFHSFFFGISGTFIIIMVSIQEIPNDASAMLINDNLKPREIIEKWLFISDEAQKLNLASNNLYGLKEEIENDTITYLFYNDDSTGYLVNREDSIKINYNYGINELELIKNNQSWKLNIVSKSENEMNIRFKNDSIVKFIRVE